METYQIIIIIAGVLFGLILTIFIRSHKKQVKIFYFIAGMAFILFSLFWNIVGMLIAQTVEGVMISQSSMIFFSLGLIFIFLHYETLASSRPNYTILVLLWICFISILVSWCDLPYQYYIMNVPISIEDVATTPFLTMTPSTSKFALFFNLFFGLAQYILCFVRSLQIVSKIYKESKNSAVNIERWALFILLIYRIVFILNLIVPIAGDIGIVSNLALVVSIIGLSLLMFNYIVHPDYLYLLPFPIHSIMIYNSTGLLVYDRKVEVEQIVDQSTLMSGTLTAIQSMVQEVLGSGSQLKFIDAEKYKIIFASLPQDKAIIVIIARQDTKLFENSIQRFTKNIPTSILEKIGGTAILNVEQLEESIDSLIKTNFPYIQFR
jgi:hypothetical protein